MKLVIRITAATVIIAAAVAGNSLAKPSAVAAIHQSNVPGPTPYCNPFTEKCAPMR